MAEETGRYTRSVLNEDELRYLRGLPLTAACEVAGVHFLLCHATPSSPLYEYRTADSDLWFADPQERSGVVLAGHTHLPFHRTQGDTTVVNPGSAGQPKHGRAEACYAIWEDGQITLRSLAYDTEITIEKPLHHRKSRPKRDFHPLSCPAAGHRELAVARGKPQKIPALRRGRRRE